VREPAILLATRVVHAAIASSSHPAPSGAVALSWLCHCSIVPPVPDGPASVGIGSSYDLSRARFRGIGPRLDQEQRKSPALAGLL
jgi:hypothetical protein